jgi:uncharacterized protein YbjT (DUF2867 family)
MGATGNTGQVAAQKLLSEGKQVRVLGRSADRLSTLAAAGAEPFVCDINDTATLTNAFAGASAVYAMIPPSMTSEDYRAEQERAANSIAAAIEQAKVDYAVTLSSVGADKESGTGPVVGLHRMERSLNRIPGLNVLHLRAAYFMENTLSLIGTIQAMGLAAGPLRADLMLPMIATRDIGTAAADALLRLNFEHHQTRELLGQRDLTMAEVARIIGAAIGKPDLKYLQVGDDQLRPALLGLGLSSNMADLILEMGRALNSGYMKALEPRSEENTTPTSYENFVSEVFLPLYRGKSTSA